MTILDFLDDFFVPSLENQLRWCKESDWYTRVMADIFDEYKPTDPGVQIYGVNQEWYRRQSMQVQQAAKVVYLDSQLKLAALNHDMHYGQAMMNAAYGRLR